MTSHENFILAGVISSAHGTLGSIVVKPFTDPATNILKMNLINEGGKAVKLKLIRQKPNGDLVCKYNTITDRTQAERLKGTKLFCLRSSLPQLSEEEFYIEDLKNLEVVDGDLNAIGKIINIFNFGA